jgi:DNA-binding response OmpR family regulator
MRLLYVEDHDRFRAIVIARFLSAHEVTVAGSLAEARAILASETFDGVLLDYDLPDGKGSELLEEIRGQWPDLPVIAASSHEAGNARLMAAGASATVGKLKFDRIGEVLEQVIQLRAGHRIAGPVAAPELDEGESGTGSDAWRAGV